LTSRAARSSSRSTWSDLVLADEDDAGIAVRDEDGRVGRSPRVGDPGLDLQLPRPQQQGAGPGQGALERALDLGTAEAGRIVGFGRRRPRRGLRTGTDDRSPARPVDLHRAPGSRAALVRRRRRLQGRGRRAGPSWRAALDRLQALEQAGDHQVATIELGAHGAQRHQRGRIRIRRQRCEARR